MRWWSGQRFETGLVAADPSRLRGESSLAREQRRRDRTVARAVCLHFPQTARTPPRWASPRRGFRPREAVPAYRVVGLRAFGADSRTAATKLVPQTRWPRIARRLARSRRRTSYRDGEDRPRCAVGAYRAVGRRAFGADWRMAAEKPVPRTRRSRIARRRRARGGEERTATEKVVHAAQNPVAPSRPAPFGPGSRARR